MAKYFVTYASPGMPTLLAVPAVVNNVAMHLLVVENDAGGIMAATIDEVTAAQMPTTTAGLPLLNTTFTNTLQRVILPPAKTPEPCVSPRPPARPSDTDRARPSTEQTLDVTEDNLYVMKKGDVYVCSMCTYSNMRRSHVTRHLVTHSAIRSYTCSNTLCGERFKTHYSLNRHMADRHSKPRARHQCPYAHCDSRFFRISDLARHTRRYHYHRETVYDSALAAENTTDVYAPDVDGRGRRMHRCAVCTFMTTNIHLLDKHTAVFHDSKRYFAYQCSECTFRTFSSNEMKTHLPTHDEANVKKRLYKCTKCSAEFEKYELLKKHVADHCSMRKCPQCNAVFHRSRELQAHVRDCSPGMAVPCTRCDLKFKTRSAMVWHRKLCFIHCDHCVRTFTSRADCGRHMRLCGRNARKTTWTVMMADAPTAPSESIVHEEEVAVVEEVVCRSVVGEEEEHRSVEGNVDEPHAQETVEDLFREFDPSEKLVSFDDFFGAD